MKKLPYHPPSNTSTGTNRNVSLCTYFGGVNGGMEILKRPGSIEPGISIMRGGVLSFGEMIILKALYPIVRHSRRHEDCPHDIC